MTQTHKNLWMCCLNPEQHERTCGYWYTITTDCSTPHTAFADRNHMLAWLALRGLEIIGELPEHTKWGSFRISGEYRSATHWSYDEFFSLQGVRTRQLSNGDYTLAIITTDEDGIKTVHTLNPNCNDRPTFDYHESRALFG